VKADKGVLGQAMGLVVLSHVAGPIALFTPGGLEAGLAAVAPGMIWWSLFGLFGWYLWAFSTYLIGTKLLPEPQTHATHNELLRTVGFAMSPGILQLLAIIPVLLPIMFVAGVWVIVATVIAVRQTLGYHSTLRMIAVCAMGWIGTSVFLDVIKVITASPILVSGPFLGPLLIH